MNKLFISITLIFINAFCFPDESLDEGIFIQKNIQEDHIGPKIAMVTVIINGEKNFDKIVSFGTRSKEVYAKKHGYDFIIATQKLDTCYGVKPTRALEPAWTKLALISRFLDKYDWIFWTDADSIILNFDIKLEDFLDDNYDIIGCSHTHNVDYPHTYDQNSKFNTGQMFYKNSEIAKKIILGAWNLQGQKTPYSWEQARINNFIKSNDLFQYAKAHPLNDFNIYPAKYTLGDFIVHMMGYHTWKGWSSLESIMQAFEEKYSYIVEAAEKELNLDKENKQFIESFSASEATPSEIDQLNTIQNSSTVDNLQSYEEYNFEKDKKEIKSPKDYKSLNEYLLEKGRFQIEGHSCLGGTSQPKYFEDLLINYPQIKLIGETGFNAGHSSETYLKARSDISAISFDIMHHNYVVYGKEYIDMKYPNRHILIEGNSLNSLPEFNKNNPKIIFDLIFIDGGHTYNVVLNDIINFRKCADSNTIVVIDDMTSPQINKALNECVAEGIITSGTFFQSKHKKWVECKYLY